ncbi:hypothetical protein [Emticicia sp. W12TSBA100-4]|uniref:hypothetical protein n=1 Tax=Emticicia sp. W12TSBA100-4 TaxID=3160965 RepID=UPI003305FCF7
MGLDITLARILKNPVDPNSYLLVSESPELLLFFDKFQQSKTFEFEGEQPYNDFVFYYEELAFQRRGVISKFYDEMENDRCLTTLSELQKLYSYISKNYIKTFNVEFLSHFNEGETFIIISW